MSNKQSGAAGARPAKKAEAKAKKPYGWVDYAKGKDRFHFTVEKNFGTLFRAKVKRKKRDLNGQFTLFIEKFVGA